MENRQTGWHPGNVKGSAVGRIYRKRKVNRLAKGTLVICKGSDWHGMPDDSCGMSEIGCPDKATPNGVG